VQAHHQSSKKRHAALLPSLFLGVRCRHRNRHCLGGGGCLLFLSAATATVGAMAALMSVVVVLLLLLLVLLASRLLLLCCTTTGERINSFSPAFHWSSGCCSRRRNTVRLPLLLMTTAFGAFWCSSFRAVRICCCSRR